MLIKQEYIDIYYACPSRPCERSLDQGGDCAGCFLDIEEAFDNTFIQRPADRQSQYYHARPPLSVCFWGGGGSSIMQNN